MAFCGSCGAEHDAAIRFCPACGQPTGAETPGAATGASFATGYATDTEPGVVPSATGASDFSSPYGWTVVGASALVLIGSVTAWISLSSGILTVSVGGTTRGGDGVVTLLLGAAAVGLAIATMMRPKRPLIIPIVGVLGTAALIGGVDASRVMNLASNLSGSTGVSLNVGFGLWLVIAGGIIGTVAALIQRSKLLPSESTAGGVTPQAQWIIAGVTVVVALLVSQPWSTYGDNANLTQSSSGSSSGSSSNSSSSGSSSSG